MLNYSSYYRGDEFLREKTERTNMLWDKCNQMILDEIKNKIVKVDLENIASLMALHDTNVRRFMAFEIVGEYPCFGNDDDRVDSIAIELLQIFMEEIKKVETYRKSEHTLSIKNYAKMEYLILYSKGTSFKCYKKRNINRGDE